MPANSSLLTSRFNEMAALAAIRSVLDSIDASVRDPSGKRYSQGRLARRERWAQVVGLATQQVQAASDASAQAPKRKPAKPAIKLAEPEAALAQASGPAS